MNEKESACLLKPEMLMNRTDRKLTQTMNIQFLSYNIQHGVGIDGRLDLGRIGDIIRQSDADIVALQEVDNHFGARSNYENQAKLLSENLGFHYVYGPSIDLAPAPGQLENQQYGTAILSRQPIVSSHLLSLSSDPEEQRTMLHAVININGAQLNVYNIHLGLDSISRMVQVAEVMDYMEQQEGLHVLLGDSNAPPEEKEMRELMLQANLTDAFKDDQASATYPAWEPEKRIDYILFSSMFNLIDQTVIHTDASDHFPIKAGVSINLHDLYKQTEQSYKEILPT
ncbi:endonuclease/exonuclease/phosphatase family protein [Aciduricibacillus chroicocephali]|uniref:Endonuclease/exonuclease/phosphatase family protein n=1 Tax=Aciduricibacillus chroicocephali TaxID=3054939 RepID=A0ABY9KUS3_9BACI|nr:endonuclease/exonuclease/phosphatase family protein [Bacillaceae bacterium 44XB]